MNVRRLTNTKHGHWIEVRDGILKCSVCDEVDGRMYWSDAYCPHCGAMMDEEVNNG